MAKRRNTSAPPDLLRTEADRVAVSEGCFFDAPAADRVREFFRLFLRHSKGAWAQQAFELLDWQWHDVIRPVFGWKRKDGSRRFRRALIWIPKKNGKSTLVSGINLYLLLADQEPGAEIYTVAADRKQAGIVFDESVRMVKASPGLSSRLEVIQSKKRIAFHQTNSFYEALSADVPTKEGINWHGLSYDELHAIKDRKMFDTLRYGGASRRQPLFFVISTAGYDRQSIGFEQYCRAKEILEGRNPDTSTFAYVAEAGPDDDWAAEETWRKANPSYGITLNSDSFTEDFKEAKLSPAGENTFKRYRLNLWTQQDVRWLRMEDWDRCAAERSVTSLAEAEKLLEGRECWGGLDLASKLDLNAFVLAFPEDDGVILLPYFWVPERAGEERERRNLTSYQTWIKQGWIKQTPGDVVDYDRIFKDIVGDKEAGTPGLVDKFRIQKNAFDPWNAYQLALQLMRECGEEFCEEFRQGYASMNEPTKEFEKLVVAGNLWHLGNPVLRWMAGNVAVESDPAGNLKPSKKKAIDKIDGVVAGIMAVGLSGVRGGESSVYDSRGIEVL